MKGAKRSTNLNKEEMYNQFLKVKSAFKTRRIAAHENFTAVNEFQKGFILRFAVKKTLLNSTKDDFVTNTFPFPTNES